MKVPPGCTTPSSLSPSPSPTTAPSPEQRHVDYAHDLPCQGAHRVFRQIPQLYTSPPASAKTAPFNLKGFDSIFLAPGESTIVTMTLSRLDFSVWDVVSQSWQIPSGATGISVGASSRDLRLKGSLTN